MDQAKKEMKTLGFCGIYKEALNVISSNTKLFTRIAICISLPSSIIGLLSAPLSAYLFPDIIINQTGTPAAADSNENLSSLLLSWRFAAFLIFQLAFLVLSTAWSLLYFSSVVYAVACICTEHAITFKNVIGAFQRSWKKLLLTWVAEWAVLFGFILLAALLAVAPMWSYKSGGDYQIFGALALLIIMLVSFGGTVYALIVWLFSGMVSIVENDFGFKALSKSKSLIKGKAWFSIRVLFPIILCNLVVQWLLQKVGLQGGIVIRTGCGVVGLLSAVGISMFSLVVQTLLYLVCKADKGESIEKSCVMDHLDMYVDGYTPLVKGNNGDEV